MIKIRTLKDVKLLTGHLKVYGYAYTLRQEIGEIVASEISLEVRNESELSKLKTVLACELIRRAGRWDLVTNGYSSAGLIDKYEREVRKYVTAIMDLDSMEKTMNLE